MRNEIPISVFRYYSNPDNQALDRLEASLTRVLAKIPDCDRETLFESFRSSYNRRAIVTAQETFDIVPSPSSVVVLESVLKDGTDDELDIAMAESLASKLTTGAVIGESTKERSERWGFKPVDEAMAGFTAAIGRMVEAVETPLTTTTDGMKRLAESLAELADKPKPLSAITF